MTDSQTPGRSNGDEFEDLDVLEEQFAADTGEVAQVSEGADAAAGSEEGSETSGAASSGEGADDAEADAAEVDAAEADADAADAAAAAEGSGRTGEPSRGWSLTGDLGQDEVPVAEQGEPFWLQPEAAVASESDAESDDDAATAAADAEPEAPAFSDTAMVRDIAGDVEIVGIEYAQETGVVDLDHERLAGSAADPAEDPAEEPAASATPFESAQPAATAGAEQEEPADSSDSTVAGPAEATGEDAAETAGVAPAGADSTGDAGSAEPADADEPTSFGDSSDIDTNAIEVVAVQYAPSAPSFDDGPESSPAYPEPSAVLGAQDLAGAEAEPARADESPAEQRADQPAPDAPDAAESAGAGGADGDALRAEFDALLAEPGEQAPEPGLPAADAGQPGAASGAPSADEAATWNQLETGELRLDPHALGQARAEFESLQQNVTAEHERLRASAPQPPVRPDAPLNLDAQPMQTPPGQPYAQLPREIEPEAQAPAEPSPAAYAVTTPEAQRSTRATRAQEDADAAARERHEILHPREPDTDDELAQSAINRVRSWISQRDPKLARDHSVERISAMLEDPDGLDFAIRFIDRVVRSEDHQAAAREFEHLSRTVPEFLDWYLKFAISMGGGFGLLAPGVVIPMAKRTLRRLVSHLVVEAAPEKLGRRLEKLRADGSRLSVNLLGETVLGEQEAQQRLDGALQLLARPDVDAISLKVSSLAPHLNLWGFDETATRLAERLTPLFKLAASTPEQKHITLDMEEYDEVDLTIEVFKRVLANPELRSLEAGIVLQAYLPETVARLADLTEWARARVAAGGAGIKVRLVKGANLARERVDAALHGWPLVTEPTKVDTDANFKRVLQHALLPENAGIVRVGVGSHNLFDLAYAIELAERAGVTERVDIEMLLGMATEYIDAIRDEIPRIVLYTPVVGPRDFDAAVAYLVRRLEESALSENFMSRAFDIGQRLDAFELERDRFLDSLEALRATDAAAEHAPNRTQNRGGELTEAIADATSFDAFFNEPDTDPALAANRDWGARVLARASTTELGDVTLERNLIEDVPTMDRRIRRIVEAAPSWRDRSADDRRGVLYDAAVTLGAYRGRLIETMAAEAGKTIAEADTEVSRAIDFCRYYGDGAPQLEQLSHANPRPVGLTVVVSPWSLPASVPCGGVAAALATGSTVILKPSRRGRRTAAVLCEALWEAGVPRDVLVFCDIEDREVAQHLIAHEAVGRVLLTGSTETAELFTTWRPGLPLLAETSGKNGMVITPAADLDLAIDDLVRSAFGHAGQRRSAASLGILVGSVGRSERFRRQLRDAVQSLRVAWPTDPQAHVGPLIEPAHGRLERALTTLEAGETWLVEPRRLDVEGRLWSPGVRIGVQPGSYTHLTEFFGPHLSLIEVPTLTEAIAVQNGTDFGLAAGIHTLDAAQIVEWLEHVEAGSLHVNRSITGSIVQRQPFGGWKLSQIGPGAKSGGPNHLTTLVDWEPVFERPRDNVRLVGLAKQVATVIEAATPHLDFLEFDRVRAGANSDQRAWESEFGVAHDRAELGVERNVLRYRPAQDVLVRLAESGTTGQLMRVLAAATRAGAGIRISSARELPPHLGALIHLEHPPLWVEQTVIETDAEFHARLLSGAATAPVTSTDAAGAERAGHPVRRIRLAGDDPKIAEALAGNVRVALYDGPVTTEGRLELLPFLREQSVSLTAHRYGNPDQELLDLPL